MNLNLLDSQSAHLPFPEGVFYGQYESEDYINNKLFQRNLSDTPLKPLFDFRSLPTRNTWYPAVDDRLKYKQRTYETYTPETVFAPINTKGPISGYRVDDESRLKNIYFALQHGADQRVYVPNSDSDLYRVSVPEESDPQAQAFPGLFMVPPMITEAPPAQDKVGQEIFNNSTKTQIRGL